LAETSLGTGGFLSRNLAANRIVTHERDRAVGRLGHSEAGPVPWTLSAWRRRVHQWAENTPRPTRWNFRQKVVELARSGRHPDELATEFGLARQTVRNWIKQSDLDSGHRNDGLTSEERVELTRLRRENKQLKVEREILSKAAAWFARETEVVPKKSSDS
jgi:transposase